jgi:hypothetical protein
MNGWNHVLAGAGGETYCCWGTRVENCCVGDGDTFWYDEVDEVDEADEQEENTDSLSESELPEDVECWKSAGE